MLLDTNKHKAQTIMKEESISKFGTGSTFFRQSDKLRSNMVWNGFQTQVFFSMWKSNCWKLKMSTPEAGVWVPGQSPESGRRQVVLMDGDRHHSRVLPGAAGCGGIQHTPWAASSISTHIYTYLHISTHISTHIYTDTLPLHSWSTPPHEHLLGFEMLLLSFR